MLLGLLPSASQNAEQLLFQVVVVRIGVAGLLAGFDRFECQHEVHWLSGHVEYLYVTANLVSQ